MPEQVVLVDLPVIDQRGYRRYDSAACDIGALQTTAYDRIFFGNFEIQ